MRKARHILAITLVATALCADRAISAAPQVQRGESADVMSMAGRLVGRLKSNFRRVVPAIQLYAPRVQQPAESSGDPAPLVAVVLHPPLSPFQFRLPPPSV